MDSVINLFEQPEPGDYCECLPQFSEGMRLQYPQGPDSTRMMYLGISNYPNSKNVYDDVN